MSLKSCEKVETNVYELEISLEGEAFKAAVSKAYAKNKGKYKQSCHNMQKTLQQPCIKHVYSTNTAVQPST